MTICKGGKLGEKFGNVDYTRQTVSASAENWVQTKHAFKSIARPHINNVKKDEIENVKESRFNLNAAERRLILLFEESTWGRLAKHNMTFQQALPALRMESTQTIVRVREQKVNNDDDLLSLDLRMTYTTTVKGHRRLRYDIPILDVVVCQTPSYQQHRPLFNNVAIGGGARKFQLPVANLQWYCNDIESMYTSDALSEQRIRAGKFENDRERMGMIQLIMQGHQSNPLNHSRAIYICNDLVEPFASQPGGGPSSSSNHSVAMVPQQSALTFAVSFNNKMYRLLNTNEKHTTPFKITHNLHKFVDYLQWRQYFLALTRSSDCNIGTRAMYHHLNLVPPTVIGKDANPATLIRWVPPKIPFRKKRTRIKINIDGRVVQKGGPAHRRYLFDKFTSDALMLTTQPLPTIFNGAPRLPKTRMDRSILRTPQQHARRPVSYYFVVRNGFDDMYER